MARKRTSADGDSYGAAGGALPAPTTTIHTPRVKKAKSQSQTPSKPATPARYNSATPAKSPARATTPSKLTAPSTPSRAPTATSSSSSISKGNSTSATRRRATPVKPEKVEPVKAEVDTAEEEDEEEDGDDSEEGDEEDDGDEEDEEDDEIAAPVVFQCGTCRSIFGDSYAFVCSNAELLLVTLSAVTNITVAPESHTSREGLDLGSSFLELLCKQCQTVLGRKYLTTSRSLDAIRSLYSFATSSIASYQLGYPQLSAAAESDDGSALPSMDAIAKANAECDQAVQVLSMDRKELLRLRDDMSKVQNLLLVVDERLHQLETQAEDSEAEDEEDDDRRRKA